MLVVTAKVRYLGRVYYRNHKTIRLTYIILVVSFRLGHKYLLRRSGSESRVFDNGHIWWGFLASIWVSSYVCDLRRFLWRLLRLHRWLWRHRLLRLLRGRSLWRSRRRDYLRLIGLRVVSDYTSHRIVQTMSFPNIFLSTSSNPQNPLHKIQMNWSFIDRILSHLPMWRTYLINLAIHVFVKPSFQQSALHEMTNAYHFLSL